MVTVTTDIPSITHSATINTIMRITKQTPSITPRTKKQLHAALKNNHVALAFDGDRLVGWLVGTSYSNSIQEIGMAYILPKYRDHGIINQLIAPLVVKHNTNLAVTYETYLVELLVKKWSFRHSSLFEFNKRTGFAFLYSRISSLPALSSAVRHIMKSKPTYLISNITYEKR